MSDARPTTRHRVTLLLAIAVTFAATGVAYQRLVERRARLQGEAGGLQARFREALVEAEQAVVSKDLPRARDALTQAATLLDAILAGGETQTDALLRHRMSLADRLGFVTAELGDRAASIEANKLAVDLAWHLFRAQRTDDRARSDLLATSRKLADALALASEPVGSVLTDAASGVELSLTDLPAGSAVLDMLADTWLAIGRDQVAASRIDLAQSALEKAARHVEAATQVAAEPIDALAHEYAVLAEAAELFAEQGPPAFVADLAARATASLETRDRLEPGKSTLRRTLAARYNQQATDAAGRGEIDAALTLYQRSVEIRRELLRMTPESNEAKGDLVLGLTHLARFQGQDDQAAELWREAVEIARTANDRASLTRAIGSYSQVLGKLDRMVEAKAIAAEAYQMAKADASTQPLSAAVAALRHARMLRARPNPDRAAARRVAGEGLLWLKAAGTTGSAQQRGDVQTGLDALQAELR